MSTILKALRRVEEERPSQPQRRSMRGDIIGGGAGKPPPAPKPKKPRGPNLVRWGSVAAVLLLAALVWWRLPSLSPAGEVVEAQPPGDVAEAPAPAAPSAAAAPIAAATEPAAAAQPPAAAPAVPAPAAAPDAGTGLPAELAERLPPLGETLDAPAPAPAAPAAVAPPAPPVEQAAPPAPSRSEASVARSEPQSPPVAALPEPVADEPPLATPAPKPPPVAAKRPAASAPPPAVAKRTAAPPPTAPEIQVERTSWHPKPERRVAWVRLEGSATRELHEGDALGTLVVKEIRPSAVVFLHGRDELQRRVGAR